MGYYHSQLAVAKHLVIRGGLTQREAGELTNIPAREIRAAMSTYIKDENNYVPTPAEIEEQCELLRSGAIVVGALCVCRVVPEGERKPRPKEKRGVVIPYNFPVVPSATATAMARMMAS